MKIQPFAILAAIPFTAAVLGHAAPPQLVTNPTLPPAHAGLPYGATLMTGGTPTPTAVAITGLPAGLSATHDGAGSVSLTGTPAQTGSFALGVVATNADGTATLAASLRVNARFAGDVAQVASGGGDYYCALLHGGLQCWGDNSESFLGNGGTAYQESPVATIAPNSGVVSLGIGGRHSCVVLATGSVLCWGRNGWGETGTPRDGNPVSRPTVALAAGSGATRVSSGDAFTCAIVNGGVQCWGYNGRGSLGDGTLTDSYLPVQAIPAGSGVVDIAAGGGFACAVLDGGVKCWGSNDNGELGIGGGTLSMVPVTAMPANSGVTAIYAGFAHVCAIRNGGLVCWGANFDAQLGDGTTIPRNTPTTILADGSGVTGVSAAASQTCVIIAGGLKCWGLNDFGQLGDGTFTNRTTPVDILPPGSGITGIAFDGRDACALISGSVQCWGTPTLAHLGTGEPTQRAPLPVQIIPAGSGVTDIAALTYDSCAIVSGGLRCWYDETFEAKVPASSGVTAVAAERDHHCIVVNGGVQCWGNKDLDLGGDNGGNGDALVQAIAAGSGAIAVGVAPYHTCALLNGGVKCWGWNGNGDLTNAYPIFGSDTPVDVIAAGSGATALAVGGTGYNCAIVNGGVQCWGPTMRTVLPAGSGATAIASSTDHACAVVAGFMRCWGANDAGQLADGTTTASATPVPPSIAVTAVATGPTNTCALIGGGVRCWGLDGSLADGVPVMGRQVVPAGSGVTAVSTDSDIGCAVTGGGVACWGTDRDAAMMRLGTLPARKAAPALPPWTLKVITSAHGAAQSAPTGIDCGTACSMDFFDGDVVVVTALPDAGYAVSAWTGCDAIDATRRRCTVTMNAARTVGIAFALGTDLLVTQTFAPDPGAVGKDVVYRVAVTNAGPITATNVTLTDAFTAAGAIWASPGCGHDATTLTCALGTLAPGQSVTVTLVLRPTSPSTVTSLASVAATEPDLDYLSNSASAQFDAIALPAGVPVPRYRLYNPLSLEHLYTTDLNEYTVLGAQGVWAQEGTVGKVLDNPGSFNGVAATPYYRLYNTVTLWHHWTTDPNEYYTLVTFPGWNGEGMDGFILPSQAPGTTQLYRLTYPFVPGLHHWTIDAYEYATLVSTYGWVGEGGSGFVVQ